MCAAASISAIAVYGVQSRWCWWLTASVLLTLFFGSPHSDGSCRSSSGCCSGSHPPLLLLLLPSSAGRTRCGCCKMLLLLLSAGDAPSSSACKLDMLRAARLLHGGASCCVALMHSILCADRQLKRLLFLWCCCYCQNTQYTEQAGGCRAVKQISLIDRN
jgi:hypothetical protein